MRQRTADSSSDARRRHDPPRRAHARPRARGPDRLRGRIAAPSDRIGRSGGRVHHESRGARQESPRSLRRRSRPAHAHAHVGLVAHLPARRALAEAPPPGSDRAHDRGLRGRLLRRSRRAAASSRRVRARSEARGAGSGRPRGRLRPGRSTPPDPGARRSRDRRGPAASVGRRRDRERLQVRDPVSLRRGPVRARRKSLRARRGPAARHGAASHVGEPARVCENDAAVPRRASGPGSTGDAAGRAAAAGRRSGCAGRERTCAPRTGARPARSRASRKSRSRSRSFASFGR